MFKSLIYSVVLILHASNVVFGRHYFSSRLIGGRNTRIEKHPYFVSVWRERNGLFMCGGSILNETTILTAAHCSELGPYLIRAGSAYRDHTNIEIRTERVVIHPFYDPQMKLCDIALMFLERPLAFSDKVQPLTMVHMDTQFTSGYFITVLGWGLTSTPVGVLVQLGGERSSVLQEVDIPLLDYTICDQLYYMGASMFCAGDLVNGGLDSCGGDSGGPAIFEGKLGGVVSWGIGCGEKEYPGVYANIANLRRWIEDFTRTSWP